MEIIIKETKEITNTELNDCLNNVSELVINSKHNQKKIADQLGKIVSQKMYETDFDSLKDFCNYIGLGQATLSQYKTFFAKVDVSLIYDCLPEDDYSYTQIMESIKIIDELDTPFLTGESLRDNGIYPSMSCKEIRQIVNSLLIEESEESEDIEESEDNEESEDIEESEDNEESEDIEESEDNEEFEDIEESEDNEESEDIEESEDNEESEETEIVESFIDYLNRIETGIVIDDFDVKMFKNISSYLKGVIK